MFAPSVCTLVKTVEIMDQLALDTRYSAAQQQEFTACARAVEATLGALPKSAPRHE